MTCQAFWFTLIESKDQHVEGAGFSQEARSRRILLTGQHWMLTAWAVEYTFEVVPRDPHGLHYSFEYGFKI
jgi:hypothetical protein